MAQKVIEETEAANGTGDPFGLPMNSRGHPNLVVFTSANDPHKKRVVVTIVVTFGWNSAQVVEPE